MNESNDTSKLPIRPIVTANYLEATLQRIEEYVIDAVEHLLLTFIAYIALCCVLYFAAHYWTSLGELERKPNRVLFVTAHPDDECMFFGPSIIKLTHQPGCQVHLLCLSKGNFSGEGATRKAELWKACMMLGIAEENITLVNSTLLLDNPRIRWREDVLARIIMTHIEELNIDTVITFDKNGVSLHSNHCSIFYALAYLCLDKKIPSYCTVYTLESTNLLRKYSLLLDIPISYLISSYRFILSWEERCKIVAAMYQHQSQLVWFRRLYMIFSRYTMINTLSDMNRIDLELDFEVGAND